MPSDRLSTLLAAGESVYVHREAEGGGRRRVGNTPTRYSIPSLADSRMYTRISAMYTRDRADPLATHVFGPRVFASLFYAGRGRDQQLKVLTCTLLTQSFLLVPALRAVLLILSLSAPRYLFAQPIVAYSAYHCNIMQIEILSLLSRIRMLLFSSLHTRASCSYAEYLCKYSILTYY